MADGVDGEPTKAFDEERVEALTEEIRSRGETIGNRISAVTDRPVVVVAVTKGHPVEAVLATQRAGYEDIGENYAQEMLSKWPSAEDARWHFVGRLQRNKVRSLVGKVHLWQSVDRPSLVRELARRSPGAKVLLQANLAGSPERGGCARGELSELVTTAKEAGLQVEGLMGVAPEDPSSARESFEWLASRAQDLQLPHLSIGMSGDLEEAVAAGSTMVRIGTALLGPRALSA